MKFEQIKNIGAYDDHSELIFITIDIDWAHDEVLKDTIDVLNSYDDVRATFFVTHETELLDEIRSNINFELGIHPNFNPLLNGDFRYGKNYKEVLDYYLKIVPNAVSVRSHSLACSSPILDYAEELGLKFECNQLIPFNTGIVSKSYSYHGGNLTRVPHCFEDDVHAEYGLEWRVELFLDSQGLKVLDFHPIHVFLNMDTLSLYEDTRRFHRKPEILKQFRNNSLGTRTYLIDLLKKGINENCNNWKG